MSGAATMACHAFSVNSPWLMRLPLLLEAHTARLAPLLHSSACLQARNAVGACSMSVRSRLKGDAEGEPLRCS